MVHVVSILLEIYLNSFNRHVFFTITDIEIFYQIKKPRFLMINIPSISNINYEFSMDSL